jgi:uncharacterized membrane protein YjfL (UPF0719 family)
VDIAHEGQVLLVSILYAVVGIVILLAAYRLFDAFTPTKIGDSIFHEKNVAAAVAVGSYMIGVALIVAAALR